MRKAGNFRHRVQLQKQEGTQNPITGEMVYVWVKEADIWAEIVPSSAREFITANAEQSEVRGRIVIRYRPNIDATMRIVHNNTVYQILGVLRDNNSLYDYITLPVSEGVRL